MELQKVLTDKALNGHSLRGATPKMAYKEPFISSLSNCIRSRFVDLEEPLMLATKIGSPRLWPNDYNEGFFLYDYYSRFCYYGGSALLVTEESTHVGLSSHLLDLLTHLLT